MANEPVRMVSKIYGNVVTVAMRQAYERKDFAALADMVPDMTVADALAVCTGKARMVGDSDAGFTVEQQSGDNDD